MKDDCCVDESEDAFLRLPTSFGKPARYEVLSFACLTVNKATWVQGGVATPLSCQPRRWLRVPNLSAERCCSCRRRFYTSMYCFMHGDDPLVQTIVITVKNCVTFFGTEVPY